MRLMRTFGIALLFAATTQCEKPQDSVALRDMGEPPPTMPAAAGVRIPIDGLPILGSDRALVTMVAFTDYQCPYCARAEQRVAALREAYGDDLRVAVAQHPLPMHDHARRAALAALAAAEQGKLAPMHARLFDEGATMDEASLSRSATLAGLDVERFDAARRGASTLRALERDEALAKSAGVTGTPTFFVNGRRIAGAQPMETFRAIIDEELAKARALVARGVRREDVYAAVLRDALPLAPEGPSREPDAPFEPARPEQARFLGVGGAPLRGPPRAPVTVVVFSDFECPFCARATATLRELEEAFSGKLRIAYKQRPLPMHPHARLAARASLAAHAQGKFWEYHDLLFSHRDALDRASLERYARDVGLDAVRFGRDLESPDVDARLAADEADARGLGAEGTPTFYVNGRRIVGAQPIATFKAAVERALAEDK